MILRHVTGAAIAAFLVVLTGLAIGPGVPDAWNPFEPLDPQAAPNLITSFKVERASRSPELCFAALSRADDLRFARMPDRNVSTKCHIRAQTALRAMSAARLSPVNTTCGTTLRLYMWTRHVVQPAAQSHFSSPVTEMRHMDSYSCRTMRTGGEPSDVMSAHATADAIDISGFALADGRVLSLRESWRASPRTAAFWHEVRDGACDWFRTVLSPDFNSLHADHFHLAQGRWGACR